MPRYEQVVKQQGLRLSQFTTELGQTIDVNVIYETYGDAKGPDGSLKPVAVILPYFLGNEHAGGFRAHTDKGLIGPGYWCDMIGPGAPIDTDEYHVISFAPTIGTHFGPSTHVPGTQKRYGSHFPRFTTFDCVRTYSLALDQLGVKHVDLLVGASMGSLLVLTLMFAAPQSFSKALLVVPGGVVLSSKTRALLTKWLEMFANDREWMNGDYPPDRKPIATFTQVLAEFWYRSNFPIDSLLVMDEAHLDELEKMYAGSDDDFVHKTIDAALLQFKQHANVPELEAFKGYLAKVVKGVDPDVLVWQLRTVETYDIGWRSGEDLSVESCGPLLASPRPVGDRPFLGKEICMIVATGDDLLPHDGCAQVETLARNLGANTRLVSLPGIAPHGLGLSSSGLRSRFGVIKDATRTASRL